LKNSRDSLEDYKKRTQVSTDTNVTYDALYKNYEEVVQWAEEALIYEFYKALSILNEESKDFWPEVQLEHFSKCVQLARNFPLVTVSYIASGNAIKVDYAMEEALGGKEAYASAVKTARDIMGISQTENQLHGISSSYIWYMKLYQVARMGAEWKRKRTFKSGKVVEYASKRSTATAKAFYWRMMQERINAMDNKAPYWYLVEYGNFEKLSSDKSNMQSPIKYRGQRFVAKAKEEARKTIAQMLAAKIDSTKTEAIDYTAFYENEVYKLEQLSVQIDELLSMLEVKKSNKILSAVVNEKIRIIFANIEITEEQSANFYRILYARLDQELKTPVPESKRVYLGVVKGRERTVRIKRLILQIRKLMNEGGKLPDIGEVKA
jgi:hypothetical protein